MLRSIQVSLEQWSLRRPFRISRGTKTEADLVIVRIAQDGVQGMGECAPNPRYGEDPFSVMAQIRSIEPLLAAGLGRAELAERLPAGSARCAVDCALWDLEAGLGCGPELQARFQSVPCARTIGIDTPERMAATAAALGHPPLVKVKVDGDDPEVRLVAVRRSLPQATIIVDANEGWTAEQTQRLQPLLAELGIAFLEQPLPAGDDHALAGLSKLVPICADESCRTSADVARLTDRYDMINIKLDKTGGLTEALALADRVRAHGLGVMVGCMVATSLSMAPALIVAATADYVDLDGPWLLKEDRGGGMAFAADGLLHPPAPGFWGAMRREERFDETIFGAD